MMPSTPDPSAFLYVYMLGVRLNQAQMVLQALQAKRSDGTDTAELQSLLTGLRLIQCAVQDDVAPPTALALHHAATTFLLSLVALGDAVLTNASTGRQAFADLTEDNVIFDIEMRRFAQTVELLS